MTHSKPSLWSVPAICSGGRVPNVDAHNRISLARSTVAQGRAWTVVSSCCNNLEFAWEIVLPLNNLHLVRRRKRPNDIQAVGSANQRIR